jgi:hypothetical protein
MIGKEKIFSQAMPGIFLLLPLTAYSEDTSDPEPKALYLCDGIWSTRGCESPQSVLPYREFSEQQRTPEQIRKKRIEEILHPLRMMASEMNNEYKVRYDISTLEILCGDLSFTLAECIDAANSECEKLSDYRLELMKQKLKREEIEHVKKRDQEELQKTRNTNQNRICDRSFWPAWYGFCGPIRRPVIRPPYIPPDPSRRTVPVPNLIPRANPGRSLSTPSGR